MKLLFALLLLATLSPAQTVNARIDKLLNQLSVNPSEPGYALLVRKEGKSIYQRTRGVTDLRTRTPITSTTDFRLASCTKQFTAMSIMLLVHDGKLRYDQRLTDIFPKLPAYTRAITIRNLLNHTAGLPDYEDLMDLPANKNKWSATHQITDAEVLQLLEQTATPKFAPGTAWAYSNTGYVVLGEVMAKVSGMTFPDFLRARIFAPLKMTNTVAYVRGTNSVPNRAYGHSRAVHSEQPNAASAEPSASVVPVRSSSRTSAIFLRTHQQKNRTEGPASQTDFIETDQSSTSATLGDGGVYSNLVDLAKWDDALAQHTLLSAEEMKPALTPFTLPDGRLPKWSGDSGDSDPLHGRAVHYGFGWFVDPLPNPVHPGDPWLTRMWHYGDTIGFKSAIVRFTGNATGPNADRLGALTIIILTNRTDIDPAKLAEQVAAEF